MVRPRRITNPAQMRAQLENKEMSEDREMIGIDVWMCGTIYVEASSQDEAERIVAERYAGTLAKPNTYNHMDGEDLPLDGDDFQSSAVTLYGIAKDSELVGWQSMDTAPKDGKHCILAMKRGPFVYAIQGAFMNGKWMNAGDIEGDPLCWMPNVRVPAHFLPWTEEFKARTSAAED